MERVGIMPMNPQINDDSKECEEMIYSDEYADFIVGFASNLPFLKERYQPDCIQVVNSRTAVIYKKREPKEELSIRTYGYAAVPKLYGLLGELEDEKGRSFVHHGDGADFRACDTSNMEASGVLKVRRQPLIDLTGQGVILGFVDTGIDYQNPLFQNEDGTGRILKIWDQTIPLHGGERDASNSLFHETEASSNPFSYGTVFSKEELEESVQGIPLTRDENGHGTAMAAIAAGNIDLKGDFTGVAYLSDIMAVKLKPAKEYLKEFYGISKDVLCYEENDIMMGVMYLLRQAEILGKPIIICLGVGTNMGGHEGVMPLPAFLSSNGDYTGIGIVAAAGNETNRGHHYRSPVLMPNDYEDVEINVAEKENGFTLELWAETPNLFSVGVISPTGEFFDKISARIGASETLRFLLEKTVVKVDYEISEGATGDELVMLRFFAPASGIWRIRVYNEGRSSGQYDMWLPKHGFIKEQTFFMHPDPFVTVCNPANARRIVVSAAYHHVTGSIFTYSGRGYVRGREARVVPTFAAPGVDIYVPVGEESDGTVRYGRESGTSIAAAHTAGVCALLMEWGFIQGNQLDTNTNELMKVLIRGARRRQQIDYPNRTWGYGELDLYGVLESLRLGV